MWHCVVTKLYILEWLFIVPSTRCTCIMIMFNQLLDMPHLTGGWIILAKKKCSLTGIWTHLCTTFERNKLCLNLTTSVMPRIHVWLSTQKIPQTHPDYKQQFSLFFLYQGLCGNNCNSGLSLPKRQIAQALNLCLFSWKTVIMLCII